MPTREVTFNVVFGDPRTGPAPLFSNHLGVARAGTEVQFEFAFLDINVVARTLQEQRERSDPQPPVDVPGRTVAKIVMPLHVFIQLKPHLTGLFNQIERDLALAQEEQNEPSSVANV